MKPTGGPLVSVIAICYNHERFTTDCLESIRLQTYPEIELIILDDGSTDGSVAAIRGWLAETGTRATFVAHADNRGVCRTRNEALRLARGKYLAMISTDDVWLPRKLEAQVPRMEMCRGNVAFLYSDAARMDEVARPLPGTHIEQCHCAFGRPPDGRIFETLMGGNFVPSLTTLVRRRAVVAAGGWDEQLVFEDWDLWLRLSRTYEVAFSPDIDAVYRIVEGSFITQLQGPRKGEFFESLLRIAWKNVGVSRAADANIVRKLDEFTQFLDLPGDPGLEDLRRHLEHPPAAWSAGRRARFGALQAPARLWRSAAFAAAAAVAVPIGERRGPVRRAADEAPHGEH